MRVTQSVSTKSRIRRIRRSHEIVDIWLTKRRERANKNKANIEQIYGNILQTWQPFKEQAKALRYIKGSSKYIGSSLRKY